MMNPQVTAALISAAVALVVGLLGIAGAIAGQAVAARRAFRNSLALFERQYAAETESRLQEREEAAGQENARSFAEERRMTYAKFLRLADELVSAEKQWAYYDYDALHNAAEIMRYSGEDPSPAWLQSKAGEYRRLSRKCLEQYVDLRFELEEVVAEIDLLASGTVREAARLLAGSAAVLQRRMQHATVPAAPPVMLPGPEPGYDELRIAFLARARHELGVEAGHRRRGAVVEALDLADVGACGPQRPAVTGPPVSRARHPAMRAQ